MTNKNNELLRRAALGCELVAEVARGFGEEVECNPAFVSGPHIKAQEYTGLNVLSHLSA